MNDIALSELLASRGFHGAGMEPALDRLRQAGLTRAGKTRIAEAKIEAVDRVLAAASRATAGRPPAGRRPATPARPHTGSRRRRTLRDLRRQRQPPGGRGDAGRDAPGRLQQTAGRGRLAGDARRARTALPRPHRAPLRHRRHHPEQEDGRIAACLVRHCRHLGLDRNRPQGDGGPSRRQGPERASPGRGGPGGRRPGPLRQLRLRASNPLPGAGSAATRSPSVRPSRSDAPASAAAQAAAHRTQTQRRRGARRERSR